MAVSSLHEKNSCSFLFQLCSILSLPGALVDFHNLWVTDGNSTTQTQKPKLESVERIKFPITTAG